MIPKKLHKIWIQGNDKIPDNLKKYDLECQKVNNDFENILWDDNKIRNFLVENYPDKFVMLYDKYQVWAQKADFARYAILYVYGGVYIDMDMVCRKNLSPLLNNDFFFTGYSYFGIKYIYLNGVIGTIPKHEVFHYIFKNLFARQNKIDDIRYSTGLNLFYDSIEEYKKETGKNNITMIDTKYLHPCHVYQDNEECFYSCKDCYIAHTSYSSWNKKPKVFKFIYDNWLKLIILLILVVVIVVLLFKNIQI